ncbi:MAG: sigma-70 family RNA polymerase sigma factor [Lentisphaerae bacterium]|jgi:RNA polymerase sigma-70 factor, ECF subfamily|nr:sigma-70 family RNA polymerase sigma factor [Lentisphaerota bacterium]MBT4819458.1 sigma-70 family RNA polymerase sigma factor [Lentisphaerota bacterium]MBT5612061.1 sigma-70 family RNA polymerase sigma factor [Lentisphaerota bacterium]MBT7056897.1 sigma-70 family RNA polymerase sigma factor [Lentisphaerota bacterium]MBT7842052.1 sigma-70 family RNA polymerase sigma factor [Lentisphaerota bacterium]
MDKDVELVTKALADGPEAFGPIVERYRDAVFGVALARLGNFHDAEDVAQTVFVEAYMRLDRFRAPMRLGPWLRRMAINRSIDQVRRRKQTVEIDTIENDPDHGDVHESLKGSDLRDQVLEAIGRLGRSQRETVTLYYVNGYSVAEVAAIQESPTGTVKRRLHEARKKLKEDMMSTVEAVLKSEAPKEDFGEKVFAALDCYGQRCDWGATSAAVLEAGEAGLPGFVRALNSRQWQTRRFAGQMLGTLEPHSQGEDFVELLKAVGLDSNKKVRQHALGLLVLDIDEERKRREFLPMLLPFLKDRSALVRRRTALELLPWAGDVPLSAAAEALANEENERARPMLAELVRAVLKADRRE